MDKVASVIIPCWNVEKWLPECMEGILAAAPSDAEILAVDDGSTDGTRALLERYAERDGRVNVIAQPNRGVSAARNAALGRAVGRHLFFVDPDDVVEPDFISAMIEAMERDGADYCLSAYSEFADATPPASSRTIPLREHYHFKTNDEIRRGYLPRIFGYSHDDIRRWNRGEELFATREMGGVWRAAFRRDLVERHRIRFDESLRLWEDAMFNCEYLIHAESMTSVDRALYHTRLRTSGATGRLGADGAAVCRNKLALLAKRKELDEKTGGELASLFAGSCALSAMEMLSLTVRGRLPRRDGWRMLREYLADDRVDAALKTFPVSARHPLAAAAAAFLKSCRVPR